MKYIYQSIPHQNRNKYYLNNASATAVVSITRTLIESAYGIPTNVSELVNDANYATKGYVDKATANVESKLQDYATYQYIKKEMGDIESILTKIIGE